jgi:hypothetical protein
MAAMANIQSPPFMLRRVLTTLGACRSCVVGCAGSAGRALLEADAPSRAQLCAEAVAVARSRVPSRLSCIGRTAAGERACARS